MCVMGSVTTAGAGAGRRILVHGHRGARAVRPENTMAAFEYAIAAGADAIELDLAVTRDNVLVVSHDPALHAPACTGPRPEAVVRQMELAEVRQWDCGATRNPEFPRQQLAPGSRIPTLDEVLDLAPRGRFDFNIEAKINPDRPELTPSPEEFARLVLESVRSRGLQGRVIFQSFDFRILHAMMALDPAIRRAGLYSGPARDFSAIAKEAGAGIVAPEKALVTPARVRAAHDAGLQVVPWTANTPEEWDRLAVAGVDAIITDDPAALLDFLRKHGLH
jgi:glycerophosphoryl diester phosphodiesterase